MFCVKCGKKLEQGKCPSCGFVDNTYNGKPPATEGSVVVNEQQNKQSKANKTKFKKVKEKKPSKLKAVLSKEKTQGKRTLTKKRKKAIIIIAAAGAVVLLVGAFLTVYFIRDTKYMEAISYLENDKPETAKKDFEELKSFKDSEQYLEDCNTLIAYNDAVDAYENAEYEDALEKFRELGRYEDSEDYTEICQNYVDYNGAKAFFDAGNFEQAKAMFVALGDFEDSIEMATSCQNNMDYNQAQVLLDAEDYEGAKRLLVGIPEFKDSEDMVFICECLIDYEDAMDAYNKGNYVSAIGMFKGLETKIKRSSIDLTDKLGVKQIKYYLGQSYYKQELFYSAYIAFNSAKGYKDATSMASKCEKPIVTEELYEHPSYTRNSVKFIIYAPKDGGYNACVKVYTESGTLISTSLIAYKEKLKIYLPSGRYYFEVSFGDEWFGEKEAFGTGFERTETDRYSSSYYYEWEL